MSNKQNMIFLGGGNMAEAIFAKLIQETGLNLKVIQRNPEKLAQLQKKYPTISLTTTLDDTLQKDDILVLAIKPQHAKEACLTLADKLKDCIIVSVMAGISTSLIKQWLNNPRVIRTMPNTPASISKGVTAIYYPEIISQSQKQLINHIFEQVGSIYIAKEESEIDRIIPITSSAVAFVYYFMEGMIDAAVNQFGFGKEQARALIIETLAGSVAMVDHNPTIEISELRRLVTSKKGTTEQGLLTFERHNFHSIINEAMKNCYNRSIELAKEFS